jgi:hypothetical protein
MSTLTLPLDPTGKATTNDITGELQNIGTNPVRAFATNYGAFFASSLVLVDTASGKTLTSSQYFTAVVYDLATAKYGVAVNDTIVGIVVITDATVGNTIRASYQALGGGYQTSLSALANDLIGYEPASRPTAWPSVIDALSTTPASQALHDAGQAGMITFEYVVHAIDRLMQLAIMGDPISQMAVQAYANAMETNQLAGLNAVLANLYTHEANQANPHRVTAAQLGAYTTAQQDAAIQVEATNRTTEDNQLTATLTAHTTNYNNPHQVTLAELGMYSSATVNSNITAAQTALQATLATNAAAVGTHINNFNNPHNDTTTNLGTLTVSQIQTAIANATTAVANNATTANTTLSSHTGNFNNPHAVTPAQIGTWTASALTTLQTTLTNHISNYSNPHHVNISQIAGLTVNQFNAALSAAQTSMQNYYNSNYSAIVNHINNGNNPHGDSAQAMGALGPWNLGTLENDLNSWQTSINNSGYPYSERGTQYFDVNYTGAIQANFQRDVLIYRGTSPTITGGCYTCTGAFQQAGAPGGGVIIGFFRSGNVLTLIIHNGSLDGTTFSTSNGDNVTLSNGWSDSWFGSAGNLYTAYGANSQLGQASRDGYWHATGFSGQGQPPAGYVNGAAPPPPTSGGGQTCHNISCFIAGTKVLMADYSWKEIQLLEPGDMLMSPTGPAKMLRLHQAILGTGRAMLTMKEDPSTQWVADHPLWSRNAEGKQWWWSGDAPYMRSEVDQGLTAGLKDIHSVFEDEVEYAHLDGFVKRTIVETPADPNTPVYIPVLEGPPCIVNGYVAAAFFNEWEYDYTQLDWLKHAQAHKAGALIANAELRAIAPK